MDRRFSNLLQLLHPTYQLPTIPLASIINYYDTVTSVGSSVQPELSEGESYFDKLPLEIVYYILERLDWEDVQSMVIAFKQLQHEDVISRIFFRLFQEDQIGHMLWDLVDNIQFFVQNDLDIASLFKRIWSGLKAMRSEELLIPLVVLWAQLCWDKVIWHSIKPKPRKVNKSHRVKFRLVKVKSRTVKVRESAEKLLHWIWHQYTSASTHHSESCLERPATLVPAAKLLCRLSPSINTSLKSELRQLESRSFYTYHFTVRRNGLQLRSCPEHPRYITPKKDEFIVEVCKLPLKLEQGMRSIEEWIMSRE